MMNAFVLAALQKFGGATRFRSAIALTRDVAFLRMRERATLPR